jgi:hypothetical protein
MGSLRVSVFLGVFACGGGEELREDNVGGEAAPVVVEVDQEKVRARRYAASLPTVLRCKPDAPVVVCRNLKTAQRLPAIRAEFDSPGAAGALRAKLVRPHAERIIAALELAEASVVALGEKKLVDAATYAIQSASVAAAEANSCAEEGADARKKSLEMIKNGTGNPAPLSTAAPNLVALGKHAEVISHVTQKIADIHLRYGPVEVRLASAEAMVDGGALRPVWGSETPSKLRDMAGSEDDEGVRSALEAAAAAAP